MEPSITAQQASVLSGFGLSAAGQEGGALQWNCPHPPQGALRQPDGSVLWRIWAPLTAAVSLVIDPEAERRETAMTPEEGGYFVYQQSSVQEGLPYAYKLGDGREYPDPASRWQPQGVHRPSAVFFPEAYHWSDTAWRGVAREDLVLYELHVGVFTPAGTFEAITARLPQLRELGVTAVELMPVAQFPGNRNWGYDGVHPYAVQNSYGGPRGLQHFVDAAHQARMAVFLDVVYNHFGPEGNYLGSYGPYFTDRYRTPWGTAVNYDGPQSDVVRQFVVDNACMWVRDFHLDGLRLDAVHAIYDFGACHILEEIQAAVQREAARTQRPVYVIAESDQNDVRLVRPRRHGGYGLDGVWSDDFHHSVHALLTGEREGYYVDFGEPAHLARAMADVFVYDGCYSPFRRRRHGSRVGATDRTRFVVCIQNHDQVGNRARGDRLGTLISPAAQRLASGLLLLSPCVPLLFMGDEYGEQRPFPFFCSFGDPQLVEAIRRGRHQEFAALEFRWGTAVPDPQDVETFAAAKLAWAWPEESPQAQLRRLYQDLLSARRNWPALRDRRRTSVRLLDDSRAEQPLLLIERGGNDGVLAVANLTAEKLPLAKPGLYGREVLLTTEDARYGGGRYSLPSPACGRGAGGEGLHAHPLPTNLRSVPGEGRIYHEILPYELLMFHGGGA
jgi:maltooligosyltrehalose trehalohydrolase